MNFRHITIKDKKKNFYSFATKYCHHHNSDAYPIYDSFVLYMLKKLHKEEDLFTKDKMNALDDFTVFKSCIDTLADSWKLPSSCLYLKLDKYLWSEGKKLKGKKNE